MITIDGKELKTAIVHDWFCNMGGGDKVVEDFLDVMPNSPIYTSCYLKTSLTSKLKQADIRVSFIQKHLNQRKDNHQKFFPVMPMAFEEFDFNEYDIVLSSSSSCAKGIVTNPEALHICYCNTPMRYAWEYYHEYTENMGSIKKKLVKYLIHYMRIWDAVSANRVDCFIANSQNVANRIWKHYRRKATVIHPPIDTEYFIPGDADGDFYLCVSRLVKYKRIDLAVAACNRLKLPLVIIGQGTEMGNLRNMAGKTVQILGRQPDEVVREYYQKCKAFLFPGEEDFGMTPLETQSCGRPVIAFGKGGALETVVEGKTGMFFKEQTVECLMDAIRMFQIKEFSKEDCIENARQYSVEEFKRKMQEEITMRYREFQKEKQWEVRM